jgi:hypothetical protein
MAGSPEAPADACDSAATDEKRALTPLCSAPHLGQSRTVSIVHAPRDPSTSSTMSRTSEQHPLRRRHEAAMNRAPVLLIAMR